MLPLLLAALAGQGLGGLAIKYGAGIAQQMRTQEADEKEKKQKTILDDIYGDVDMSTPEGQAVAQQRMLQQPMTFGAGLDMQNAQLQRQHAIELENLRNTNQLGQMGYGADLQADRDINQFGREWAKMKYEAGQNMSLAQMRLKAEREAAREERNSGQGGLPKLGPDMYYQDTPEGPRAAAVPQSETWNKANAAVTETTNALARIGEIQEMAKGSEYYRTGTEKTKMLGMRGAVVKALSALEGAGQLEEGERKFYESRIPDPSETTFIETDEEFQAAYEEVLELFREKQNVQRQNYQGWGINVPSPVPRGFTVER